MFVINYDFSQYHSHYKFLLINIPVFITEALTYPLQRIQTQLITRDHLITKNQVTQCQLILKEMIGIQGFPKFLHGVRYSIDYTVTQMTAKFFVFDWLMQLSMKNQPQITLQSNGLIQIPATNTNLDTVSQIKQKMGVYLKCIAANAFGTFLSQSAFNYQVLASSLPINAKNRSEDVKQKMLEYTKNRKNIPLIGLKYTIPVSIYNTVLQVLLIQRIGKMLKINKDPSKNYTLEELSIALTTFFVTGFAYHFSYLRQVQLIMNLGLYSIPYAKGLSGTMLRHVCRGMTLYSLYFLWFQHESKGELSEIFEKRESSISQLPSYRK